MERFSFENQGTSTYLVCNLTGQKIDTMSLGMLTNNKIPGLAPALYTQQDEAMLMKYNVSSHIALRQFFSGAVNKKRLLGAFSSIVTAFNSAEEYMLDLNTILLNLDYIFADVTSCSAILICVPVLDMPERKCDYGTFFKQIMFSTQFDQTEDCGYVTQIINYLNGTGAFSVEEFGRLLNDLSNMTGKLDRSKDLHSLDQTEGNGADKGSSADSFAGQNQPATSAPVTSLGTAGAFAMGGQSGETSVLKGNISGAAIPAPVQNTPKEERASGDMSLFYLMQHYNKQNAAEYKAQKAAKKQAEKDEKERQKQEKKQKKKDKKGKQKPVARPAGMAVPQGMQAAMAIPSGSQANASMAVPSGHKASAATAIPPSAPPSPQTPAPQTAAPSNLQTGVPQMPGQPQNPYSYKTTSFGSRTRENFGETTVLSSPAAGETTVLTNLPQEGSAQPYLFRQSSGEKIALNRPLFRIGKEPSFVDYPILDNAAISRSHANFISKDGICYVVDTNSTNHTYVNGAMIASNVETRIKDGDLVRLANEEFQFRMI